MAYLADRKAADNRNSDESGFSGYAAPQNAAAKGAA
jgi:hypothetical protein